MLSSRADAHARIIMCAARVVMGPLGFSSPRFAQKRTTGTTVPRSSQFNNSGHWKKDQGVHESRKRNQHKVHVSTNATGVPRVAPKASTQPAVPPRRRSFMLPGDCAAWAHIYTHCRFCSCDGVEQDKSYTMMKAAVLQAIVLFDNDCFRGLRPSHMWVWWQARTVSSETKRARLR